MMFIIMYFSFKFNFGNDPTVSAPDKGLCCKPTNTGKNDKMICLYWLSFLFSSISSFDLSFQLIQIFFWDPDVATSSLASEELIPYCWLLVGMFQHKEPPNHRATPQCVARIPRTIPLDPPLLWCPLISFQQHSVIRTHQLLTSDARSELETQ